MNRFDLAIKRLENLLQCKICCHLLKETFTLTECGHHFCKGCIYPKLGRECRCPKCKLPARVGNLKRNPSQDILVACLKRIKQLTITNLANMDNILSEDPYGSTTEPKSQLLFADVSKESLQDLEKHRINNHPVNEDGNQILEEKTVGYNNPDNNNEEKPASQCKIQIPVDLDSATTTEVDSETDEGISVRTRCYSKKQANQTDSTKIAFKSKTKLANMEDHSKDIRPYTDNSLKLKSDASSKSTSNIGLQNESNKAATSMTSFVETPTVRVKYQRKKKHLNTVKDKPSSSPKAFGLDSDKENVNPHCNNANNLEDMSLNKDIEVSLVTPLRAKTPKKSTSSDEHGSKSAIKSRTRKISETVTISNQASPTPANSKRGREKSRKSSVINETPHETIGTSPRKRKKSDSTISNEICNTPVSRFHPDLERSHVGTSIGNSRWSCSHCTYLNTPRAKKCTMCLKRRLPAETLKSMVPSPVMAGDGGLIDSGLSSLNVNSVNSRPNFENQMVPNRGKNYLVHVLTTGLKDLQWQELQRSLDLLPQSGLKLTIDDGHGFDENITHVVTMADENYICPRTFKYLCGVLVGKWLVNHNWIVDSITANEWLNEQNYEITGDTVMGVTFGPKKGRRNSKKQLPRLFSGCKFYLHGDFEVPSKSDLQKLIKLGGAKLLSRKPSQKYALLDTQAKAIDVSKPIIVCDAKCPLDQRTNTWLKDFQLCTSTWLFNCISCYKLLDRDLPIDYVR